MHDRLGAGGTAAETCCWPALLSILSRNRRAPDLGSRAFLSLPRFCSFPPIPGAPQQPLIATHPAVALSASSQNATTYWEKEKRQSGLSWCVDTLARCPQQHDQPSRQKVPAAPLCGLCLTHNTEDASCCGPLKRLRHSRRRLNPDSALQQQQVACWFAGAEGEEGRNVRSFSSPAVPLLGTAQSVLGTAPSFLGRAGTNVKRITPTLRPKRPLNKKATHSRLLFSPYPTPVLGPRFAGWR